MMKRTAAGTAIAGAFGLGVLGLGSGVSFAKPGHGPHGPQIPVPTAPSWHGNDNVGVNGNAGVQGSLGDDENQAGDLGDLGEVGDIGEDGGRVLSPLLAPGLNPVGPPGQVMKMATINGLPNPFFNVPPGQWRTVDLTPTNFGLPATWIAPDQTVALPLVFNPATFTWGVNVGDQFVPYVAPQPVLPTP